MVNASQHTEFLGSDSNEHALYQELRLLLHIQSICSLTMRK
jgi:hypothetical protein